MTMLFQRPSLILTVLVSAHLFAADLVVAENPFKGLLTNRGSSSQVNRRGKSHPQIRVDTSAVEQSIRRNKAINDKLGPLGKLNMQWFETRTPKSQYNFVPGYGWVETAAQGNRQIEAYRRRIEGSGNSHSSNTHSARGKRSPAVRTASDFLDAIRHADYQRAGQTIASDVVIQTAVSGLLNVQAQLALQDDEWLQLELQPYAAPRQATRQLEQLLAGIDPGATKQVRRSKNGYTIVQFSYTDGSIDGTGELTLQSVKRGDRLVLAISDIYLPSRHLTLRELYQYVLISDLSELPRLTELSQPGRINQSHDVQILLGLDPYQQESFQTGWNDLSDNAKTWPLSRFKRKQFEIVHGSSPSTEELQKAQSVGIRSDSLVWLDEFANSKRR